VSGCIFLLVPVQTGSLGLRAAKWLCVGGGQWARTVHINAKEKCDSWLTVSSS